MRIGLVEFLLILAIASLTIGPQVALFVDRWLRRANRVNARAARRRAEYAAQAAAERDALLKRFRTASTVFGVCILLALVYTLVFRPIDTPPQAYDAPAVRQDTGAAQTALATDDKGTLDLGEYQNVDCIRARDGLVYAAVYDGAALKKRQSDLVRTDGGHTAAVLTALLVWYFEQRMLARSLGRAPERADAQAAWEQHMLRKQGWTADSEPGSAALARARAGLAAIQERPHEDVFTPGLDGARLHARLYRVPNAHATVILCHGYHSRAEHDFGAQFPAVYASGGCILLLIDERAHGLSEGKCLTFGQLERYDIAQWVHWVREHSRVQRPIALYGVSMGAASVLLAAQLPELRGELACVVADCGYSSFELEVTDAVHHATNAPRWLQGPLARACVRILRRSGLDFDAVDTTPGMAALDIPILFFHGDADTFVPLHHSERNLAACRRPQRLVVIPGAEHAMAAQVDPERYRRELLVFLWRNTNYLWAERNKPLR